MVLAFIVRMFGDGQIAYFQASAVSRKFRPIEQPLIFLIPFQSNGVGVVFGLGSHVDLQLSIVFPFRHTTHNLNSPSVVRISKLIPCR